VKRERAVSDRAAARADAQRERILEAAQQCFVAEGFHAATMATIADRAGMSAGLIYRYFENKDAIVLAIIDRELQRRRAHIASKSGSADVAEGIIQAFRDLCSDSPLAASAVLFLEMTAQGTRVPRVAQALEAADQATRHDFEQWWSRSREEGGLGFTRERAQDAALLIQILFEGLAVRAAREPGLDIERLRRAIIPVMERLS
jgi:AcrR family transcriptional regulator